MSLIDAVLLAAMLVGFFTGMLFCVLTWFGVPPREDPDLLRSNGYIIFYFIGPVVITFAYLIAFDRLDGRFDGTWLANLLTAIGLIFALLVVAGFVTMIVHPRWSRPRWQRRMLDNKRGRQELREQAVMAGHTHLILLLRNGDEEPGATAPDHHDARERAQRLLADHPDADGAVIAAVRGHRRIDYLDRADLPTPVTPR